jgi:predicted outer membrane lipoprotein
MSGWVIIGALVTCAFIVISVFLWYRHRPRVCGPECAVQHTHMGRCIYPLTGGDLAQFGPGARCHVNGCLLPHGHIGEHYKDRMGGT